MTDFGRIVKDRFAIGTFLTALLVLLIALLTVLLSIQAKPQRLFPFADQAIEKLGDNEVIKGWAEFDKDSYVIGEIANLRLRLLWRGDSINPDLETFKNGIGFFPFNRRKLVEQERIIESDLNEYILDYTLQAVDVEPSASYSLAPPTVYFSHSDKNSSELQSYRITSPRVHIGAFYPPNVAKIPMLPLKGLINDPLQLRQAVMILLGSILIVLTVAMIWHFGRSRRLESLSQAEQLWRRFHELNQGSMDNRDYLVRCELIFTDLLMSRTDMSPVTFWAGKDPGDESWKGTVDKARELFRKSYLSDEPDDGVVYAITDLLNQLFSHLVEEDRLEIEEVPSVRDRLLKQPAMLSISAVIAISGIMVLILAAYPGAWTAGDIQAYNNSIYFIQGTDSVEDKYEQVSNLVERVNDEKVKAAALYNAGTFATTPELTGQDRYQQEALLEVMFQDQKVYLDALMHSLNMDDPFLLVAIFRDSVRFMTQGQAALKAAVRIDPYDDAIKRNLELIQKRRQAYAETIQELLQESDDAAGMGELQRQSMMDLEQFMQMEMPEEYAELEAGKNDKDYFILEGF